jgi:hypothetical protein
MYDIAGRPPLRRCTAFVLLASGVGSKDPDSLASVWRPGVGSSQHTPFRIIPQRGQVSENDSKPPRSEHWAVLHKRESRSYLANDAGHVSPHSRPFAVNPCALARCGYVLTRETAAHDIDATAPRQSIERLNVIPDRESR